MRIRGFPFVPEVGAFLRDHRRIFVVEQNRDGQLASLLSIETGFCRDKLQHVGTFGGLPLSARDVFEDVVAALRGVEEPEHEARLPQAAGDTAVTE
jgi:2-oxoglutarate ferredoxin oxidoreductase subunit alpha